MENQKLINELKALLKRLEIEAQSHADKSNQAWANDDLAEAHYFNGCQHGYNRGHYLLKKLLEENRLT